MKRSGSWIGLWGCVTVALFALASLRAQPRSAGQDEAGLTRNVRPLRIVCSTALHTTLEKMRAGLEKAAGRPVQIDWDSSRRLSEKIDAGEAFDVAALAGDSMKVVVQKGGVTTASNVYLGRTNTGLAVHAGAKKPDVSTPDKLKQALLNAKSIAMNPTGAGTVIFNRIASGMGIADHLKPKLVLNADPGGPQQEVVAGKAEMVWTQVTEARPYPELEMLGTLPESLQSFTEFYAGVSAKSMNPAAAAAVVKYLTSEAAKQTFRAESMEVR